MKNTFPKRRYSELEEVEDRLAHRNPGRVLPVEMRIVKHGRPAVVEQRGPSRQRAGDLEFRIADDPATLRLDEAHADYPVVDFAARSEVHTSELQSLIRISYPFFFFNKKTSL